MTTSGRFCFTRSSPSRAVPAEMTLSVGDDNVSFNEKTMFGSSSTTSSVNVGSGMMEAGSCECVMVN